MYCLHALVSNSQISIESATIEMWCSIISSIVILLITLIVLKIYLKLTTGICRSSIHLVGKVAIITGANTGVGYETAVDFAERGARVLLACRNDAKGASARDRIIKLTGNEDVHFRKLDLASLSSVREFANKMLTEKKRLDILVNNAACMTLENEKTDDGLQIGMQTNHFGPFLLTNLLLPLLKKSAPSGIVNVSSIVHEIASIDLDNLHYDKPKTAVSKLQLYNTTKLCNVLMTNELSRRLKGTCVTKNSLHTGDVITEMVSAFIKYRIIIYLYGLFVKNAWEGAQTTIHVAVARELKDVSGKYFTDCKERKGYNKLVDDVELAKKLWQLSESYVKFISE